MNWHFNLIQIGEEIGVILHPLVYKAIVVTATITTVTTITAAIAKAKYSQWIYKVIAAIITIITIITTVIVKVMNSQQILTEGGYYCCYFYFAIYQINKMITIMVKTEITPSRSIKMHQMKGDYQNLIYFISL